MDSIADIQVACLSIAGGKTENEDSIVSGKVRDGFLAVVCDGLGGETKGSLAARTAATTVYDFVSSKNDPADIQQLLEESVSKADKAVRDVMASDANSRDTGTTLTAALIEGLKAYIVNVGNSRCYIIRGKKAVFRTADDSYVGDLVRRGSVSEEMARTSPYANVLTKAIGISETLEPEVKVINLQPGDRIALLTDGAWAAIPEQSLISVLVADNTPEEIISELESRAEASSTKGSGLKDDFSVILIELPHRVPNGIDLSGVERQGNLNFGATLSSGNISSPSSDSDTQEDYILKEEGEQEFGTEAEQDAVLEYPEGDDDENPDSRKLLIWVLSICLVVAIGVILYLYYGRSDNQAKDSSEVPVPSASVTDSITAGTLRDTLSVSESSPLTPEQDISFSREESSTASNGTHYNNATTVNEEFTSHSNDDEPAEESVTMPLNTEAKSSLSKAAACLQSLRDFDPKEISKKDTRRRRQKRTELLNEAMTIIKESMSQSQEESFKSEIVSIGRDLEAPATKSKILKMDEETGLSTRASITTLDSFIARLRQLAE